MSVASNFHKIERALKPYCDCGNPLDDGIDECNDCNNELLGMMVEASLDPTDPALTYGEDE